MLKKEMDQYLAAVKADYRKWNASRKLTPEQQKIADEMAAEFDANLRIDEGTKYLKVISNGSVHSFVVIKADSKFKNGDILKAASWASPARNFTRGNVLTGNFGSVRWTGAQ
jgi:ribosomal protein L15